MESNTYERRQFSRFELTDQSIGQNLALAGQIQRSLLPSASQCLKGFELAGRSVSCTEVGGDYFDYLYGQDFQDDPFPCGHRPTQIREQLSHGLLEA